VWVWRVLLYMRKKSNAPMDLELLLYAGITAADMLSFTLALVLFLVRQRKRRVIMLYISGLGQNWSQVMR
jgi:hypothetical protein